MDSKPKLFNKNFFILWQGQFVSQLGSQAFFIAMMFWVKHQTGSASLMGILMMISMLPSVLLGPLAGTLADHYSRKKIIVYSDLLRGLPVLILAAIIFAFPDSADIGLITLFIVTIIIGIINSIFNPAILAAIPDIVPEEQVAAANSLSQGTRQVSLFIGQALGGFLFVLFGAPVLFLIDGISYIFSGISETFMKIPQELPAKAAGWKEKMKQFKDDTIFGLKFSWSNRGLRALFFNASFLNFFIMPIIILLPFYVEDYLGTTPDWYGYILGAFGFGSLIGFGAAGAIKIPQNLKSTIFLSVLILNSACFALLAALTVALHALLLMILIGIFNGFFNINLITILQLAIPGDLRGRVFGVLITLTHGLMPISMGLAGIVFDLVGQDIVLVYSVCGITTLILSIIISFDMEFRKFLSYEKKEDIV
ncbi:MFS transporter [Bacteroidota bacterium]